jgi:hypothetical protein
MEEERTYYSASTGARHSVPSLEEEITQYKAQVSTFDGRWPQTRIFTDKWLCELEAHPDTRLRLNFKMFDMQTIFGGQGMKNSLGITLVNKIGKKPLT